MRLAVLPLALSLVACVAPVAEPPPDGDLGERRSALSASARRARAAQIRDAAAAVGITEGWLLAGIADAETTMAHCHRELTWACRGPHSDDCGGPVVAGAGDGPCSIRQGGLGMFQFDAGTYEDTLRREGTRILSVAGNVQAAVDFVVAMVIRSAYVPGVSTREQAVAWINGVRIGNGRWDPWVRTVTHYYNGCRPSYSCFASRYARYRDHTSGVFHEMGGASFWGVDRCEASCLSDSRIRGRDCGEGDCAAFGATCVDDALGARCVSVFCTPRGESRGCLPDGDTLITCRDGATVGTGSCGAYGATCVDDELGARCVSVFCPARGEATACLPDGDTLLRCDDGGIASSGSCGAFGATCVDDELGARCVSVFCPPRGEATACLPDSDVLLRCDEGGIAEQADCGAFGATCVDDGLGARCVSAFCDPAGFHDACAPGDVRLRCADGAIAEHEDCAELGGRCVHDGEEARCVVCPASGRSAACAGDGALERCDEGEATVEDCGAGERCVQRGSAAACEPVGGPAPPSAGPSATAEATPARELGGGGCAASPGRGGVGLPAALILLALGARRRRPA